MLVVLSGSLQRHIQMYMNFAQRRFGGRREEAGRNQGKKRITKEQWEGKKIKDKEWYGIILVRKESMFTTLLERTTLSTLKHRHQRTRDPPLGILFLCGASFLL